MGAKGAEKEAAKAAQSRDLYEKYKVFHPCFLCFSASRCILRQIGSLQGSGNADIKAQKYESAVRWYSEALKYAGSMEMGPGPQNPAAVILSNRQLVTLIFTHNDTLKACTSIK